MVQNSHNKRDQFLTEEVVSFGQFLVLIYLIVTPGPGKYRMPSDFGHYISKRAPATDEWFKKLPSMVLATSDNRYTEKGSTNNRD